MYNTAHSFLPSHIRYISSERNQTRPESRVAQHHPEPSKSWLRLFERLFVFLGFSWCFARRGYDSFFVGESEFPHPAMQRTDADRFAGLFLPGGPQSLEGPIGSSGKELTQLLLVLLSQVGFSSRRAFGSEGVLRSRESSVSSDGGNREFKSLCDLLVGLSGIQSADNALAKIEGVGTHDKLYQKINLS
jgi:hypothetical protein